MKRVAFLLTIITIICFDIKAQEQIENSICSEIQKQFDEFNNETNYYTPGLINNEISSVIFSKYTKGAKSEFYIRLKSYGATVVIDGYDAAIIFTDNTKWNKHVKIDVDVEKDYFEYTAFIKLTPDDILTFSKKNIKKFRLYIFDNEVDSLQSNNYKIYFNCLKNIK